jgi:hypothetical protein
MKIAYTSIATSAKHETMPQIGDFRRLTSQAIVFFFDNETTKDQYTTMSKSPDYVILLGARALTSLAGILYFHWKLAQRSTMGRSGQSGNVVHLCASIIAIRKKVTRIG